jgi:hypothetical protein
MANEKYPMPEQGTFWAYTADGTNDVAKIIPVPDGSPHHARFGMQWLEDFEGIKSKDNIGFVTDLEWFHAHFRQVEDPTTNLGSTGSKLGERDLITTFKRALTALALELRPMVYDAFVEIAQRVVAMAEEHEALPGAAEYQDGNAVERWLAMYHHGARLDGNTVDGVTKDDLITEAANIFEAQNLARIAGDSDDYREALPPGQSDLDPRKFEAYLGTAPTLLYGSIPVLMALDDSPEAWSFVCRLERLLRFGPRVQISENEQYTGIEEP